MHHKCHVCGQERIWHDLRRCENGVVCLDCVPRTVDSCWLPYLLAGVEFAMRTFSPLKIEP